MNTEVLKIGIAAAAGAGAVLWGQGHIGSQIERDSEDRVASYSAHEFQLHRYGSDRIIVDLPVDRDTAKMKPSQSQAAGKELNQRIADTLREANCLPTGEVALEPQRVVFNGEESITNRKQLDISQSPNCLDALD